MALNRGLGVAMGIESKVMSRHEWEAARNGRHRMRSTADEALSMVGLGTMRGTWA